MIELIKAKSPTKTVSVRPFLKISAILVCLYAAHSIIATAHEICLNQPGYRRTAGCLIRPTLTWFKGLCRFLWSDYTRLLVLVLFLRYGRLLINMWAFFIVYKPAVPVENPKKTNRNVHVILPTIDPMNPDFKRCIESIMLQKPASISVVTSTLDKLPIVEMEVQQYQYDPDIPVRCLASGVPNKRVQVTCVLEQMAASPNATILADDIIIMVDDHVWWESSSFLTWILAPFENEKVGIVAMNKKVQREYYPFDVTKHHSILAKVDCEAKGILLTVDSILSPVLCCFYYISFNFLNFIAALYLERHNFEITSSNTMDGGIFVVSGRTNACRASILMAPEFRHGFVHETFFFGLFGPLKPDDDNFITRYMVKNGWEVKVQNVPPYTTVSTSLGKSDDGWTKFHAQLFRWARTTWRSNATSMFKDQVVWRNFPFWSVWTVQLGLWFNIALFWDPLMLYLCSKSDVAQSVGLTCWHMFAIILATKMVKLIPHWIRYPWDIVLFPLYVLFAYYHSFIKIVAGLTFYDHSWGGRKGVDLKKS